MGPTASGKTDLAMALSDTLPVELISVDSALIYRGMDIGTAKPEPALLARYPHHLIDIRDPSEGYSVAEFARDAGALLEQISSAGKIPLLVGGTMLYFKGLLEGLADLPASDQAIRQEILREAETYGWPWLHQQLQRVDPASAAKIHPNHSQRIQRALEVYRITGTPMSEFRAKQFTKGSQLESIEHRFQIMQLGLIPEDRGWLHRRIEQRFMLMLEQNFEAEVKALRNRGDLHRDLPAMRAVGYRQMWQYLAGDISREEMIARGIAATRQLAKRQLTWLRKWPNLQVLQIDKCIQGQNNQQFLLDRALNFLEKEVI